MLMSMQMSDGVERFFGNIDAPLTQSWPVYGDVPQTPMISRDKWKPMSLAQWRSGIKDQNGYGSCNAHATVYAIEGCRKYAGLPSALLSPGHLYGKINGGSDQGSTLEDGLAESMRGGVAPASVVPELEWRQRNWSSGASEAAKAYRVTEAWLCPSFEHQASAIQSGFFLITGILWYDNFNTDSDGWLPARGGGRAGGHALCRDGLAYRDGKWGLDGPNSWGAGWGRNGCCVIPESIYQAERAIGGWWAVRATIQEDGDLPVLK